MNYIIKINYNTGDSFHTEEGLEDEIDLNWTKIKIVEENLKRIKEHYEWILSQDSYSKKIDKPKWLFREISEHRTSINFMLDNGKEHLLSCCWLGYFNSLNFAEITIKGNRIDF